VAAHGGQLGTDHNSLLSKQMQRNPQHMLSNLAEQFPN